MAAANLQPVRNIVKDQGIAAIRRFLQSSYLRRHYQRIAMYPHYSRPQISFQGFQ